MKRFLSAVWLQLVCLTPSLLLAAGGGEGEHGGGHHGPPSFVWFHLINLIILAALLIPRLRRPLADFLVRRSDGIREALEKSERARKEAEVRAAELEQKLQSLTQDIEQMKSHASAEAKAEAAKLVQNAQANADRFQADAERLLKEEVSKARVQMRQEVVELAVELAQRMITERVTQQDHQRLTEDYLRQLQSKEVH